MTALQPQLVPHQEPRRRAAWPEELNIAVAAALAAEDPVPPAGVSKTDWQRVLAARQEEQSLATEDEGLPLRERRGRQLLTALDETALDDPIAYLRERRDFIPNYDRCRQKRRYLA